MLASRQSADRTQGIDAETTKLLVNFHRSSIPKANFSQKNSGWEESDGKYLVIFPPMGTGYAIKARW